MNNVTKKIISNFRKGLISESDMLNQLHEADKNTYYQYLDNKDEETAKHMSEYKIIAKEGYDDVYYWDMRYCFELNGKRYIFTDIGSGSEYFPCSGEIMEVRNDENLDILLKDWNTSNIKEPYDLTKEDAIQYVQRLKESETEIGKAFKLWGDY